MEMKVDEIGVVHRLEPPKYKCFMDPRMDTQITQKNAEHELFLGYSSLPTVFIRGYYVSYGT